MHPHFMDALARQHREELHRQQQFRHRKRQSSLSRVAATRNPLRRIRRSLGGALVAAGTRLIGGPPGTIELFNSRR
jgi:hypothetical protein